VSVARLSGEKRLKHAISVLNFYFMIEMSSWKLFEMVLANLHGPSLCQMQHLNAKQIKEAIVCEEMSHLAERLVHYFETNATKLPEVKQLSLAYNAVVVGGAYPNHFISVEDKTAKFLKDLIEDNESTRHAQEIKVVVVAFQIIPISICLYFILAAWPQTKNAVSQFNDKVISTCLKYCREKNRGTLLNFAVDGVSVESTSVWMTMCTFLAGKANHLWTTDTNHNMKSKCYQIIGGSCLGICGNYPLYAGLLWLALVPEELWRVANYASDLLVLRLSLAKTICYLADLLPLPSTLQDSMAVAVLAATVLHAIAFVCS
jgi:hypothetical protein